MANEESSRPGVSVRDLGTATPAHIPTVPIRAQWRRVAMVLALTFVAFASTLGYQFVHDDRGQIVENPAVHSWSAVPTYFAAQVWAGVMPEELGNYYRPLFLLWLRVNDVLFGNHAWGWHLTTVLAHLLVTFLVYVLVCRLGAPPDVGLLAALIFGLHPAHIEAVAWISGVTEPLLGILWIGAFLCYLQARDHAAHASKWMAWSLVLFSLGLLEKETAMILPALLVVYDAMLGPDAWEGVGEIFHVPRIFRWSVAELGRVWPYFLVIALYIPARIYALKGFSHEVTALSTVQMAITWPSLVWFWIRHLVWPVGLSTFYNLPAVVQPGLRNFTLPAILDALVAAAMFLWVRRSRLAAFFALWMVLPLVPLLNIRVFISNDFAHDRYLYLPSIGLAVLAALALKAVCRGTPRWQGMSESLLAAAACLTVLMTYGTIHEGGYFKDNLTFYAHVLTKAPNNPYAETNYATLLAEKGDYGPAIEKFIDVSKHHPEYHAAIYNLALTYYKMNRFPEAERCFLQAIQTNPNKPDQYFYLSLTYFKSGHVPEAISAVRQAIAIRPTGYAYHLALGLMLKTQGNLPAALEEYQQELANNPGEPRVAQQINELENQLHGGP